MNGMTEGFPNETQAAVLGYVRDGAAVPPALAIKAAGNAAAASGAFSYKIGGKIYAKAAIATLSLAELGTVAAGKTKTAFLTIDASGTVALLAVAPDSGGKTVVPQPAAGACLFGAVRVVNGSGADFVAGTTFLDAAGITVGYFGLSGAVPGEAL